MNAATDAGDTALHGAAGTGAADLVAFLVERGAAVGVENQRGRTPLMVGGGHCGREPAARACRSLIGNAAGWYEVPLAQRGRDASTWAVEVPLSHRGCDAATWRVKNGWTEEERGKFRRGDAQ